MRDKHYFPKQLILFILITVIPSILISYTLTKKKMQIIEDQYKTKAQWYANFHARNIENFIGETMGRLDMLATLISVQQNNIGHIEDILKQTQGKDPRFSGFYLANLKGDLISSSNPMPSPVNVGDRSYFQRALKTGKTTISEAHIGRVTGRYIVTMATPIYNQGKIKGFLLASLRLDHIEQAIQKLVKEESITVQDDTGKILMLANSFEYEDTWISSSVHIEHVPWMTTAKVIPEDPHYFRNTFFKYLAIMLIITGILFLLIRYYRLKHKIQRDMEQNEKHKLELVGNLAASTAHEIRNPLTGIKGLVKLLSEEYPDSKAQFYFQVIDGEINRINAIVSELLVLGKPTAYSLQTYPAQDILTEIKPIIESEANYMNVQLIVNSTETRLPISCVKDHLKQVILNLAKNALHSMPNGGKLTIILEKKADFCVIKVLDTGKGMSKEVLSQVFTPFFTMKKEGSGLGLTVCKRIIDTYGGSITIQSTPDVGTEVEISIPLCLD